MGADRTTPAAAETSGSHDTVVDPDHLAVHLGGPGGRVWSDSERELLNDWAARVAAAQHAHYSLMTELRRRNLALGIPVVVLSAAVGTTLFATVSNSNNKVSLGLRVFAGAISALAGVLAAMQTFLKFSERAEKHGVAADWLAAVRRDIDLVRATPEVQRGEPVKVLGELRKEINKIAQTAPGIGEGVWHRFAAEYSVKEPRTG